MSLEKRILILIKTCCKGGWSNLNLLKSFDYKYLDWAKSLIQFQICTSSSSSGLCRLINKFW